MTYYSPKVAAAEQTQQQEELAAGLNKLALACLRAFWAAKWRMENVERLNSSILCHSVRHQMMA